MNNIEFAYKMRGKLFEMDHSSIKVAPPPRLEKVRAILREVSEKEGDVVSLVVVGDGAVSLYFFPKGGGIIGGG